MVVFWREVEEQEFDWKYLIQDYVVVEGAEDACEVISWAKDQAKGRIIAVYLMAYPKVSREPSVAQLSRVYGDYPEGEKHRSEEHTSELQSRGHLVCRLLLEKKKNKTYD